MLVDTPTSFGMHINTFSHTCLYLIYWDRSHVLMDDIVKKLGILDVASSLYKSLVVMF